jgi:hypothetical protein
MIHKYFIQRCVGSRLRSGMFEGQINKWIIPLHQDKSSTSYIFIFYCEMTEVAKKIFLQAVAYTRVSECFKIKGKERNN